MDPAVTARLDALRAEYDQVVTDLGTPDAAADRQRYTELAKRESELGEIARAYDEYRQAIDEATEARDLLKDATGGDEREFYRTTAEEADARAAAVEDRLNVLLTPRDPRDDRDVIVEIRAGAGGDEAALFAGDLMRMYEGYASKQGWKTEVLDISEGAVGGFKEVVFEVKGKGAFSKLKHESGVHRVQRVPTTESQGRIHTSTVTVAVLPEADDVEVEIDPDELRIDYFRSSGPGGQHVNTTDSAVRITHLPSGIVVSMQSERSQRQNRDRAMRVLLAKLQDLAEQQARDQLAAERRSQVGTGDRAEKIRTYNFPQNRLTDHRIGFTMHGMDQILGGGIEELIETLRQRADEAGREAG